MAACFSRESGLNSIQENAKYTHATDRHSHSYTNTCVHAQAHTYTHTIRHHLSLNCRGCWGTTDDLTSFLHVSLFSTALWDFGDSRLVYSLMLSSHLFFCLPCLLPPFTVPCKMVLAKVWVIFFSPDVVLPNVRGKKKTTSRNGQAWSLPSPRGQWRTGKNGGNWLCDHLWCPTTLVVKG